MRQAFVGGRGRPTVQHWRLKNTLCSSCQHLCRHLIPFLPPLVLVSVDGAEQCPDGSAGLTKELYDGVDPAAYANVTCIHEGEFVRYKGNVVLTGLEFLQSIGGSAFLSFEGTLTISGEFPLLEWIGHGAFEDAGNAASAITFSGLPSLQRIEISAFGVFSISGPFKGTLIIRFRKLIMGVYVLEKSPSPESRN